MFEVMVKARFSAAHQLRGYRGKCEELHGHNWIVEVAVSSKKLNKQHMVIDFKDIKSALAKILEGLDHKLLNEVPPFDEINPTSENLAKYIFNEIKSALKNHKIAWVRVWESEDSAATYYE